MLILLVSTVLCSFEFNKYVMHLTGLPPNDGNPYIVMLHSDGCSHCVRLAPTWASAAELGVGVAQFAELDCGLNRTACQEVKTDGVPRILYFRNSKVMEYEGMQISRLIVNWASELLEDTAIFVGKDNYSQLITDNAAILFTNKNPIPKVWASIERYLNDPKIKFFVSSDVELQKMLNLNAFPGVYVKKGQDIVSYSDKIAAIPFRNFVDDLYRREKEL